MAHFRTGPGGGSPAADVQESVAMSLAEIRRVVREMFGLMPTLDLHGLGVKRAVAETERFLEEAQECGVGSVRIVYGKGRHSAGGRGVLREVIPRWLETEGRPYVRRFERRPDASGADGAVVVWVRELDYDNLDDLDDIDEE